MALIWDFAREITPVTSVGNTTSFVAGKAQAFYILDGKIKAKTSDLVAGQWQNTAYDAAVDVSDAGYSLLDIEHRTNGILFATAYHDGSVVLMVYEYRIDATSIIKQGTLQLQPNNSFSIANISLLAAAAKRLELNNHSIFAPGVEVDLRLSYDNQIDRPFWNRLTVANTRADSTGEYLGLECKNAPAYLLNTQTFDEDITYAGTLQEVISAVLTDCGVTEFLVQTTAVVVSKTFLADENVHDALTAYCRTFGWYVDTLRTDYILVGDDGFMQTVQPIVVHELVSGTDAFSREILNGIDKLYTRVAIRRKGSSSGSSGGGYLTADATQSVVAASTTETTIFSGYTLPGGTMQLLSETCFMMLFDLRHDTACMTTIRVKLGAVVIALGFPHGTVDPTKPAMLELRIVPTASGVQRYFAEISYKDGPGKLYVSSGALALDTAQSYAVSVTVQHTVSNPGNALTYFYSKIYEAQSSSGTSSAAPLVVYGDIPGYTWNAPGKKTLYVDVAETYTQADMEALRDHYIACLKYSGKEEIFTTAFRPFIGIGDGVIITDSLGNTLIAGVIADVQHFFGKDEEHFTQILVVGGGTLTDAVPTLVTRFATRLGHLDRKQAVLNYLNNSDKR